MSEVKTDKLSPVTSTTTTFGDSGDKLLFTTGTNLDMNGVELILDADADTSITADTDDQIDIRIAGADDFQFTANTFTAHSGSTIAAQALTATTIGSSAGVTITGTTPTLTIGDGGEEDTKIVFDGNVQDYYIGLDDTNNDLKIGLGSAVGTTTYIKIDETGAVTMPLNPAFKASGSSVSNVTGDGTFYQIVFNTDVFDANGDHLNGVFTAPVAGNYFFHATAFCIQVASNHTTAYMEFVTTGGGTDNMRTTYESAATAFTADNYFMLAGSCNTYLGASETCVVKIGVSGGSKVIDLDGGVNMSFGGFLVG